MCSSDHTLFGCATAAQRMPNGRHRAMAGSAATRPQAAPWQLHLLLLVHTLHCGCCLAANLKYWLSWTMPAHAINFNCQLQLPSLWPAAQIGISLCMGVGRSVRSVPPFEFSIHPLQYPITLGGRRWVVVCWHEQRQGQLRRRRLGPRLLCTPLLLLRLLLSRGG